MRLRLTEELGRTLLLDALLMARAELLGATLEIRTTALEAGVAELVAAADCVWTLEAAPPTASVATTGVAALGVVAIFPNHQSRLLRCMVKGVLTRLVLAAAARLSEASISLNLAGFILMLLVSF
jgi:hypothetical protein